MTNDQIIQSSLDRLSEAINKELASIPSDALGDVLANITINLFRACESELTEESFERLCDAIENDEPEVIH